jgi:hypothetical protein
MKEIKITLSNTNYTQQASTKISINRDQHELLKTLIQKIEDGLYRERAAFVDIEGILDKPITLTITEYEQAA